MECKKCNANIEVQDALNCIGCKVKYHYKCVGMSELNYKKLNKAAKSMWRCLVCKTGKNRLLSSSGKEDKKGTDTDLLDKQRRSLLNDLEDNSDDVDGDLEMKESNKSDTLTEEDTQESTPKVNVTGNESAASLSSASATERRSNRIMTRKQRDSELRLQFAKKLKTTPQQRPKQVLPNSARRFSKSDLNTSDSEAYSSPALPKKTPGGGMNAKKPALPLGNKRKSSLEYAKNKKLMRKDDERVGDTTTTTDDNDDEDTEDESEDDLKHNTKTKNTNQQNVKRKLGNQKPVSANVKRKKKDETTDEDDSDDDDSEEDESDSDTETDLEEELKKAISKKFPLYKNSPSTADSRMKKPMNNNHVARGGMKNSSGGLKNASSSVGGSGQKKPPIPTRPSSTSSVNKSTPGSKSSKQITITGSRVITKTMDSQFKNETISNVGNSKLYAAAGGGSKNIESMKIYYPNIEKKSASSSPSQQNAQNAASRNSGNMSTQRTKMVPASKRFNNSTITSSASQVGKTAESTAPDTEQIMSASPKAKSEFDKLVDELFETETTREKLSDKEPELMFIDNEPTDVYTLNIDDTLEDDSDLEALMEEVYEDETVDNNSSMGIDQMGNMISGNSTLTGSFLSDNRTNMLNSNAINTASLGYGTNLNMNTTPLGHTNINTQSSRQTRTPHQILNVNSPIISPKNVAALNNSIVSKTRTPQQQEIAQKNSAPSRNVSSNGVNKSGVETPKQISRLGSQVSVTPVTKTTSGTAATKSTANQKIAGGGGGSEKRSPNQNISGGGEKHRGGSSFGIDYKEKYNKLLTSYEMLSAKIAQYMEKTKQEKDQLKRQLKLEKNKLEKAQEDIEILKKKFEYLMKNKPSSTGGSSKKRA